MQFVYGVRVPGGFEPVCYQFAQWVVGDFNGQAEKVCESSTDGSEITTASRSGSYAGSPRHQRVIYLREGYKHECFSPLEQFRPKIQGNRGVL
ncbi:Uncharacterised protein [Klebsiella pneumoniae subsp. ozaenae]|uniref:Uncharacterized protein n=1 Tax=Klebsiella pneumoniae subsp. ozaenae TaxID=574 RepID=A0A377ZFM4_KLEPO|nr:Uncharacterised protein [Klebsiella pneumoniae subsp. ozaenae]